MNEENKQKKSMWDEFDEKIEKEQRRYLNMLMP